MTTEQVSPPDELFMYATGDACKKILQGLSLKATPPNALNDPFECLPGGYSNVTAEKVEAAVTDPSAIDRVRQKMLDAGLPRKEVDACIRKRTSEAGLSETCATMAEGIEGSDFSHLLNELSQRYGIMCFSERPDCLLMWSHYADRHMGVAIGFSPAALAPANGPTWLKVQYAQQRPKVVFRADKEGEMKASVIQVTSTKAPCWAYEFEWRLIVRLSDYKVVNQEGVYLWQFPATAITRVILGYRAEVDETELRKTLKDQGSSARIEQAKIHQRDFRLEGIAPVGS